MEKTLSNQSALAFGAFIVAAIGLLAYFLLKGNSNTQKLSQPTVPVQKQQQVNAKPNPKPAVIEAISQGVVVGQKKKKKKGEQPPVAAPGIKSPKQLEQSFGQIYYGSLSIRSSKTLSTITALTVKHSKVLFGNSRNQLVMYDLRKWKAHSPAPDLYHTSLDNNTATAVAISPNYYFAALSFDKTIAYYEFKGGEGGVYFREVKKFARNIYKGAQGAIAVGEGQKFVVSSGIEADTTISVWSMEGEKLANISTYQIEHYQVHYGGSLMLVRGWTSQIKTFKLVTDKQGEFVRLDKSVHLTHSEKPSAAVIDNLGLYALTITADGQQVKLWHLGGHNPSEATIDSCAIGLNDPKFGAVITLRGDNERLRSLVVVANGSKVVVLDRGLKLLKEFEGVAVEGLMSFGASRSAVVATMSGGRMSVWDLTKLALEQAEYLL